MPNGYLAALELGHPAPLQRKGNRVLGCNGPGFGIFHAAKISLPLAPKKSWGQIQEVPTICLPRMCRTTRKTPDTKCHSVRFHLCVPRPEQATPWRQAVGCGCWGEGRLLTGMWSPCGLMRNFWNQTVMMGAQQ